MHCQFALGREGALRPRGRGAWPCRDHRRDLPDGFLHQRVDDPRLLRRAGRRARLGAVSRTLGRLFLALALALFVAGAALGQSGRVGWDGTWAGGWDKGNGVQLVFAGETLIAFYWRNDYKDVVRSAATPDGSRTFAWDKGDATATRAGNAATLAIREAGKPAVSVALKRE